MLTSIIFLHGLTGHRERTWTAAGEDKPWPESLLPSDLPTARIITYGYDADVVHLTRPAGQNTVREHATSLINDLTSLRADANGRPIIFVVHSLGGLVCQDALLVCNNPNENIQRDILLSTRGIAFLGTPHAGADLERFATAVANIVSLVKKPNRRLLQVLNRNSETLANIKNGFLTMVNRRLEDGLKPIKLHAFIEEQPVDFLRCRVVEPDSARIPGHGFDAIPANHMDMTKFRTVSDIGYKRVLV
ncbi:Alpha/Beta hydrolase protein [Xylaria grammica]|nr:Alpha/Beta hydrolase protein [Xylaria grammica]